MKKLNSLLLVLTALLLGIYLFLIISCHSNDAGKNIRYDNITYTPPSGNYYEGDNPVHNTEEYSIIHENEFLETSHHPLSTFSIDVDAASYSNARRFILQQNQLPYPDVVRIEEFINYFQYDYENPVGKRPFSIQTEIGKAPWQEENLLVHIGLQGKKLEVSELPNNNLIFLLDVSGSMNAPNKIGLLKKALKMLCNEMRPQDRVAIVAYAGAAGLVLPSTPFSDKRKILDALDRLSAGGSTAGGAGIKLAYKIAAQNFMEQSNNRIILCTDGDFNVGVSSTSELERLIVEKRKTGIYLTVLGFGTGNYKDNRMETLADKGNGNYAYIDNIMEAKKVLVNEIGATLFTIAKDVKIQVEFNPAYVKAYRLIGYENRLLADEDFKDDTKDAGELGAGHTVTALYELVPANSKTSVRKVDELRYQSTHTKSSAYNNGELMWVKFRYKKPDEEHSQELVHSIKVSDADKTGDNFMFSAAVAEFGMLLRNSKHKGSSTYEQVISNAEKAKGTDKDGYRAEFIQMVKRAKGLSDVASR